MEGQPEAFKSELQSWRKRTGWRVQEQKRAGWREPKRREGLRTLDRDWSREQQREGDKGEELVEGRRRGKR